METGLAFQMDEVHRKSRVSEETEKQTAAKSRTLFDARTGISKPDRHRPPSHLADFPSPCERNRSDA